MKVFTHPNKYKGWKCPYCNTDDDKPVVLIPVAGTEEGGKAMASQIHYACLLKAIFGPEVNIDMFLRKQLGDKNRG